MSQAVQPHTSGPRKPVASVGLGQCLRKEPDSYPKYLPVFKMKKTLDMDMSRQHHLQTWAVLAQIALMVPLTILGYIVIGYMLLFTGYYWIALAYTCYILRDKQTASMGSRPSDWVRRWTWWSYIRDYFPLKLVKTAELDPANNYLLCGFPHGVLSTGIATNFATEANNVSDLFPGISHHVATLDFNVNAPFVREMIMRMGICSCSRESLAYLLDGTHGKGRSVLLLVGGAAEALMTKGGAPKIFLKKRKGFVKLALKYGACLVPVFSFGENDLYDQVDNPEGGWFRWCQEVFRKVTGVAPVLAIGEGLFGVTPRRRRVTTVVGKPMLAEHIPEPTQEQIDDLHSRFQDQLVALFEEHKYKYLEDPEHTQLVIE